MQLLEDQFSHQYSIGHCRMSPAGCDKSVHWFAPPAREAHGSQVPCIQPGCNVDQQILFQAGPTVLPSND